MEKNIKKEIALQFVKAACALFIVPVLSLLFVTYGQRELDARLEAALVRYLDSDQSYSQEQREAQKIFVHAHPGSQACEDSSPENESYRNSLCPQFSEEWQFMVAKYAAWVALIAGVGALIASYLFGLLARINRSAQLKSFMVGRRLLTFVSILEIVLQGALAVWLSFWVTALLFERYYIKLILIVGLLAMVGIWVAIVAIFKKPREDWDLKGELVKEEDAPGLWKRIREIAIALNTAPPQNLIAGIDDNFFVVESKKPLSKTLPSGRSLFVSLPLLRTLETQEAEAILAHELGHFQGGDTEYSAALHPELVKFDRYLGSLGGGLFNYLTSGVLNFYRVLFEVALKADSREREFFADQAASKVTSPSAFARALTKTVAYSNYRAHILKELFSKDQHLEGNLTIGEVVEAGFLPHAKDPKYGEELKAAHQVHPFDSHPPLQERLLKVGVKEDSVSIINSVSAPPSITWADEISTAKAIEGRLWSEYEEYLKREHERVLAYRYKPSNSEEKAHVEKYFPPLEYPVKKKSPLKMTYEGVVLYDSEILIPFDEVIELKIADNDLGGKKLYLIHNQKDAKKNSKTVVAIRKLGKNGDKFLGDLNLYFGRNLAVRAYQEEQESNKSV